jgi:hypothetical protein
MGLQPQTRALTYPPLNSVYQVSVNMSVETNESQHGIAYWVMTIANPTDTCVRVFIKENILRLYSFSKQPHNSKLTSYTYRSSKGL